MRARDRRREKLRQRVGYWSKRLKVGPRIVRVQRMTRKWGSCSTSGVITLADDLPDREHGFQDFVIAHELLHLRVPNHGKVFKALMSVHVPDWREHDLLRLKPKPGSPRDVLSEHSRRSESQTHDSNRR
ncbi:MAG: M48 family metallopeptidase [Gemmatimonadota bacterium]|nr:M48 family metallopeptidase [Gemmatimonadota bacterium]